MADKIVVLRDGRIEQVGAPIDLYNRPVNTFVAGFIGSPRMNFLPCTVKACDADGVMLQDAQGRTLRAAVDGRTLAEGETVELGIRPEHLHPDPAGYPVEVENVEQLGGESYLYARTETGVALTAHLSGQTSVGRGARTHLAIRPQFAHVFRKDGTALTRLRLGELETEAAG